MTGPWTTFSGTVSFFKSETQPATDQFPYLEMLAGKTPSQLSPEIAHSLWRGKVPTEEVIQLV